MSKDYLGAIIGFLIVAAAAVGLLYLGATGRLPVLAFFDMENLGVRAVVVVILLVLAGLLYLAFRSVSRSTSDEERKSVT